MKHKVYIAIPTVTGFIYFELAMRLIVWSRQKTIPIVLNIEPFQSPIDHARNVIAQKFLASDCTHLMMIDDDIVPPEDTLERMLFHNKDIVGAPCPLIGPDKTGTLKKNMNVFNIEGDLYANGNRLIPAGGKGLTKVDAVGTGCILIKRGVIKEDENIRELEKPFSTIYDNHGLKRVGEDISFCIRAGELGYKTYADFSLKCKHLKLINLLEID